MAVPFFHSRRESTRGTVQWLLCAHALLQGFGKGQAAVRRMPSKIFCMAGGRTGAQTSGFRVRMAFSQGFGKMQINFCRNASRGQPFGCPLLCGLSAAYRGAKKYRIPSVSGYGILRKK